MKKIEIIALILAALVAIIIIYIKPNEVKSDALKFKEEYESLNGEYDETRKHDYLEVKIDSDNVIKYSTIEEIENILENGTGIIYFGFPECPWCRNAVPVLLEAAKDMNIDTIYYYNAYSIRDKKTLKDGEIITEEEGTEDYKKLVELMYDFLPAYSGLGDDSIKRLYFPTVVFVKEGKIVGLHTSTVDSQEDPFTELDKEQKEELKTIYTDYINEVYEILCDEAC
jgi:thiol-disulfide isomerase/thioredoxin